LPKLWELCEKEIKIPVLLKDEDGKTLFYGKVKTKAILDIYASNPHLYNVETILNIVEEEIAQILTKGYIAKELITIRNIEKKKGTIVMTITIRNRN